ncbi:patatin-like phospholipase family protein [Falsiroseomonas sp. E2-1-a20]|uniref:patatin-like phospholipase family protein n=1 Tax=Falsiroseomonas sp. E2-1-a20 TaxID=3239300 RepID=UPI003F3E278A
MRVRDLDGLRVLAFLAALLAAACTTSTRGLPEAQRIGLEEGYRPQHVGRVPGREPALPGRYVILAFSGGGTRAAALAQGALRELGATPGAASGTTLLHAVDMVSSVSGGSVTAANFVLNGPEGFSRLHEAGGFLHHDGMADLAGQLLLNPINALVFTATPASRIEVLPEMLRRQAFGDATFRDLRNLAARRRPLLLLNAADMQVGQRFTFTQEQLDRLCLDLSQIRLVDAVAASAAFPVALTPLPLPVRSPCRAQAEERAGGTGIMRGFEAQARLREAIRARREDCNGQPSPDGRRVLFGNVPEDLPRALRQWHYLNLDGCGRPLPWLQRVHFVHLADGGTADNLGLSAPLEAITGGDAGAQLGLAMARGEIREVVVITVNARSQGQPPRLASRLTPTVIDQLLASINTPIDGRSGGLLAELNALGPLLRDRFALLAAEQPAGAAPAAASPRSPEVRILAIDFEKIADAECRTSFQGIGTNWSLAPYEVEALQEMASGMMRADRYYLELIGSTPDAAGPGLSRARSACDRLRTQSGPPLAFGGPPR